MDDYGEEKDRLTVAELKAQKEALQREIQERELQEKKAILDEIYDGCRTYGITLEDLITRFGGLPSKRKGIPAKAKYRDPISGALWSGRGKEPIWIRGKDRTVFLIPDGNE